MTEKFSSGMKKTPKKQTKKQTNSIGLGYGKHVHLQSNGIPCLRIFKDRGPGTNSSQLKNFGKIQLSMQLSHLSIILKIYGFSKFFGMGAATLLVHHVSIFRAFRKIIVGVIKKRSSEAVMNFELV